MLSSHLISPIEYHPSVVLPAPRQRPVDARLAEDDAVALLGVDLSDQAGVVVHGARRVDVALVAALHLLNAHSSEEMHRSLVS